MSFFVLEMAFGFSEGSTEVGRSLPRFSAWQCDRIVPGRLWTKWTKHIHQYGSYTLV